MKSLNLQGLKQKESIQKDYAELHYGMKKISKPLKSLPIKCLGQQTP
jgi:hypothetical protein